MTGANVFHWTAAKAGQTVNTNAAGTKTKTEDSAIAGMFAFMISANSTEIPVPTETQEPSGNVGISAPVDAYDRYQYRDTEISRADTQGVDEKITESKEELGDFKEQVIAEVAEELDVSEEEVLNVMELLGMTAYDLMKPANLAQLAVELTGAENSSELLMNPDFVDLMKSVRELGDQLMTAMELPADQRDELIAHMDVLEQPEVMAEMPELLKQPETPEMPQMPQTQETTATGQQGQQEPQMQVEVQVTVEQPAETVLQNQAALAETETVTVAESGAVTETETVAVAENEAVAETEYEAVPEIKAETGDEAAVQKEQPETVQVQTGVQAAVEQPEEPEELPMEPLKEKPAVQPAERAETETEKDEAPEQRQPNAVGPEQKQSAAGKETKDGLSGDDTRRESGSFKSFDGAVNVAAVNAQDFKSVAMEMPVKDAAFTSIDTIDIIEQIVEQVKVNISGEATTMELQLNPENLGKVYVQVSAREGSVHAQITAANEAVRNALEAQAADLKQNLNQAGVKVDAIEVTVASHEFEQNLEQNARREGQEGEQAEAALHRRNIRLDELDEMAGVMTEEEALVAQIMKENGNTMDLSA